MRYLVLSKLLTVCLCLTASLAHAFEIENQRLFGDPADAPLRIISTADTDLFEPYITSFRAQNPTVSVDYVTVSSAELNKALNDPDAPAFDVALSSAMDLQTKLANDGLALSHQSPVTELVPDWGKWRSHVYAFTQEPAAIVLSPQAFQDIPLPRTRQELISVLRDNPDHFRGKVATYDVRQSGLGYLFATQDARTSETFWRLAEVMGNLDIQLYCCSGAMIDDVISGKIAVAYNVLGSYVEARDDAAGQVHIVRPQDFTTIMLRTVLIPARAEQPELAGEFVDHLLRTAWDTNDEIKYPFNPISVSDFASDPSLKPIRLGPGLLVYLDRLKKRGFLREWEAAILQP